jgi:DNA-binding transcriptional ArsR family regulator
VADPDLSPLLAFFKAMANESRLRIVGLLAQRERTVQELAETLSLKEPTVSHHLAVLKALGLVTVRPEGVMRWHALNAQALTDMNRRLLDSDAASRPAAAIRNPRSTRSSSGATGTAPPCAAS